ncbi:MAG: sulfotransferase family protein [Gaiellales bacterium]
MSTEGLRVVGAGLGRTGTHSLMLALEQLLGGRCYHMAEVIERPDDVPVWHAAIAGEQPDWRTFLDEYAATVDWPACAFWQELAAANPGAIVLLSVRASAEAWWKSFEATIAAGLAKPVPADQPDWAVRRKMVVEMLAATFTPDWHEREAAIAAYEAHNASVRAAVPPGRLVEWQPADGWEPLCSVLNVPVPAEPFPRSNSTEEFQAGQHAPDAAEPAPHS